jgi:hypothetical protein
MNAINGFPAFCQIFVFGYFRKNVLACKSSIIPPRFIDVHVLIQTCEQLCIYVLGVSILSLRFYDF